MQILDLSIEVEKIAKAINNYNTDDALFGFLHQNFDALSRRYDKEKAELVIREVRHDLGPVLHHAIKLNLIKTFNYLVRKIKVDVNAPDEAGNTALHIAVTNNNDAIVTLLIKHGADKNLENDQGKTPVMLAKAAKNKEVCEAFGLEFVERDVLDGQTKPKEEKNIAKEAKVKPSRITAEDVSMSIAGLCMLVAVVCSFCMIYEGNEGLQEKFKAKDPLALCAAIGFWASLIIGCCIVKFGPKTKIDYGDVKLAGPDLSDIRGTHLY